MKFKKNKQSIEVKVAKDLYGIEEYENLVNAGFDAWDMLSLAGRRGGKSPQAHIKEYMEKKNKI